MTLGLSHQFESSINFMHSFGVAHCRFGSHAEDDILATTVMVMCFYKSEACEPGKYMNINQSEKQFLRGMGNKQPS